MSHTLTLEELVRHPEITNVIVKHEPRRCGAAFVALERGGPISIAYEVYGNGPIHLVFIMGLNGPRIAWHRQIKYFGIDRGDQFTVLVFDNRGVGDSDAPWALKYSTSDMAKDTVELCDFLSWTKPKQLHVIGVSMGGMIAQELAYLIPDRVASLILQSTAAALVPTLPWHKHLLHRATMLMPKTLPQRLAAAQRNLFSPSWLVKPDDHGVFPTNADRYVAEELWRLNDLKPPVIQGFLLQGLAATWHYVGPDRLKTIGEKVDRIMVCTGTGDEMIEWGHSTRLVEGLRKGGNEVHYREWLGVGHVLLVSWNDQRNKTGASSEPGKGVRVSFVRKGTADHIPANRGYIHALLVEPYMNGGDPDYRSLENVISGGLVWRKDYLYITDDKIGLRVFDLRHIYKVQNGNNAPVGNSGGEYWGSQYPYVIPQAYIYTKTLSEGTNFNPHPMSLDRNFTPPCLVIGESSSVNNNSTFVRWSLNDTTNLLATDSKGQSGASWAYKTNIYNAEGITFAQDNYFITTNDGDDIKGELYQWRPGTWANAYEGVFPPGVQAISYKPAGEELWVVGNIPGKRYVMALNASLRNTTFPADDTGNGTSTPPTVIEAPVERKMTSGAIAGATIAVLVTVAGVLAAILMFQRRRKRKSVAVVAEHYAEERVYSKPELAGVQRGDELWSQKELPAYRQQVMHEMPHATERYELGSGRDPVRELPTGMGKWN